MKAWGSSKWKEAVEPKLSAFKTIEIFQDASYTTRSSWYYLCYFCIFAVKVNPYSFLTESDVGIFTLVEKEDYIWEEEDKP